MKLKISAQNLPLLSTAVVCVLLLCVATMMYKHFFAPNVFLDLVQENAFLGVAAVGTTFVILAGGIDLSIGAVIGFTTISLATMIVNHHVHPAVAIASVLAVTTLIGAAMGAVIHFFAIPPFLITLAGLFFYRGSALLISTSEIAIDNTSSPAFHRLSDLTYRIAPLTYMHPTVLIFAGVLLAAAFIARFTAFGRSVYAIGGAENSAMLMGLPVARNKVLIYAISGLCSGLAGVTAALYFNSGNALHATGLELDAIAVVVVGGTLLSGGVGSVWGTFLGLLIFGIIQTVINFQNLNSWWTRIAVGVLLLAFILLQKLIRFSSRQPVHA